MPKTTLFIPDISGFTKFVNETEISHSRHIISELLEILIDSNKIKLEISEIEGDAILFYRLGEAPAFEDITKQSELMFSNFHEHLKRYEYDRVCSCGACSTAGELSLKFIVHEGDTEIIEIKNFKKLHGEDVILAHSLLKNNIDDDEYVLLSDNYSKPQEEKISANDIEWIKLNEATSNYKNIGDIKYSYFSLKPLLSKIQLPKNIASTENTNPAFQEIMINAPMEFVHHIVTDINLRSEWQKNVKEIIPEKENAIERIGSKHRCITTRGSFDIEVASSSHKKNQIEFSEKTEKLGFIRNLVSKYIFSKSGDVTKVRMEVYYEIPFILNLIFGFLLKIYSRKQIGLNLKSLKEYCEKKVATGEKIYP